MEDIIQDDVRMGFHTWVKPEYFVVSSRYRRWLEGFRRDEPEVWISIGGVKGLRIAGG